MSKERAPRAAGPPGRPALPPEAEQEIMAALGANMRISSGEIAASSEEIPLCSVPALRQGLRPLHSFLLSPPQSLRWIAAGPPRRAQWSGSHGERRNSEMSELSPQAEARDMELVTTRCSDRQALRAIRQRIQSQMNGLDDSAGKVRCRIRVLDRLLSRFRKAG